jgi:hypothetical protein
MPAIHSVIGFQVTRVVAIDYRRAWFLARVLHENGGLFDQSSDPGGCGRNRLRRSPAIPTKLTENDAFRG